jgi:hypothetical protein
MTLSEEMNVVDEALEAAVDVLKARGMPEDEAHIALLIRLWSVVPDEVSEVAELLRNDPELAAVINPQNEDINAA